MNPVKVKPAATSIILPMPIISSETGTSDAGAEGKLLVETIDRNIVDQDRSFWGGAWNLLGWEYLQERHRSRIGSKRLPWQQGSDFIEIPVSRSHVSRASTGRAIVAVLRKG